MRGSNQFHTPGTGPGHCRIWFPMRKKPWLACSWYKLLPCCPKYCTLNMALFSSARPKTNQLRPCQGKVALLAPAGPECRAHKGTHKACQPSAGCQGRTWAFSALRSEGLRRLCTCLTNALPITLSLHGNIIDVGVAGCALGYRFAARSSRPVAIHAIITVWAGLLQGMQSEKQISWSNIVKGYQLTVKLTCVVHWYTMVSF